MIEEQVIKEIQSNSLSVSGHKTGCLRAMNTQELITNLSFSELDVIATTRFQDLITNLSFGHFDLIAIHFQDVITNLNFSQLDLIAILSSSLLSEHWHSMLRAFTWFLASVLLLAFHNCWFSVLNSEEVAFSALNSSVSRSTNIFAA